MNRQNEKPIEYESTPLWQHPLSIVAIVGVLSAGAGWYIYGGQSQTQEDALAKMHYSVTEANQDNSNQVNNGQANKENKKANNTQGGHTGNNRAYYQRDNTRIQQVNPNDIAVLRVHDADQQAETQNVSASALNKQSELVAQEVDELESRLIADEVEELEHALQVQQLDIQKRSSKLQANSTQPHQPAKKQTQTTTNTNSLANNNKTVKTQSVQNKVVNNTVANHKTTQHRATQAKSMVNEQATSKQVIAKPVIGQATNKTPQIQSPSVQATQVSTQSTQSQSTQAKPQPTPRYSSEINLTKEQIQQLAQELKVEEYEVIEVEAPADLIY